MTNSDIDLLLIDDDQIVLKATALALEIHGYSVQVVDNGAEAIKIITNNPDKYKIILLDLMMNDISGYEVLISLKNIVQNHDISVIIHSGIGSNIEAEKAKNLGAREFISKPYTINELIEVIERCNFKMT